MSELELNTQQPLHIYPVAQAFRPKKICVDKTNRPTNVYNHQPDSEVTLQVRSDHL